MRRIDVVAVRIKEPKRKPGPNSEASITSQIRQLLKNLGIWHWKQWQGPMSQPRGVSDILGMYEGRMMAIEVKTARGVVSEHQQAFLDRVNREGGIGFVARSIEDVLRELKIQGVRLF